MFYLLFVIAFAVLKGMNKNIAIRDSKARLRYCIEIFVLLFLFAGLRGMTVGIDTANRYGTYSTVARNSLKDAMSTSRAENGYILVVFLLSHLYDKPWLGEMVYAAFILATHIWFMNKYCDELPLTVVMFVLFNFSATMNTTRQYLAISFVLIAMDAIIAKKGKKAILFIIIAYFFHSSAMVCLAFCLLVLPRYELTKKRFLVMIPISVVIVGLYSPIINFAVQLMPRFRRYLFSEYYSSGMRLSYFWLFVYAFVLVLIVQQFSWRSKSRLHENIYDDYRKFQVMILSFLLYAVCDVTSVFFRFVYRIMRYFAIGFTVTLPETAVALFRPKDKKIIYFGFMLFALAVGYLEFRSNKYRIFPYVFFWE